MQADNKVSRELGGRWAELFVFVTVADAVMKYLAVGPSSSFTVSFLIEAMWLASAAEG